MGEIANQPEAPKESQVPQQPKKSGKAGKVIIALIILLLIGIIAALGYFIYNNLNKETEREKARVVSNTGYVGNVDPSELQRQADDSRFTTNMNVVWNFETGSSESLDAFIGNLEMNSRDVYVDVTLANDPTEEVIYSSPIIPRGQALSKFKLDKELEAGSYDAVCIYSLIDENENVLSTLSIAVTINILN